MGRTDIRRRLIVGAISVIRRVVREGGGPSRWLTALVAQAEEGHGRRAREQEGAHDLGGDDEAGRLPDGVTRVLGKGRRHGMAARPG